MIKRITEYFDKRIGPGTDSVGGASHYNQRMRIATAALLLEMANIDFSSEPEEIEAIHKTIQSELGLSANETEELMALAREEARDMSSYFQFTSIINKTCTPEEKAVIIEMLWKVAIADGRLDNYEEHFIRKIANLIYVPRDQIVAAKHSALKESGKDRDPV
ncbi:MAG: hypothetical protein AMJ68_02980 [Acidithiobacillales bacterium SG8_45]|jgi:uncharacterized tellurite resistance protein B-like protein|nr:MAG: hypothetical protein AMJ68_02980 [Acidithiobacillales bacterium SG8_45]